MNDIMNKALAWVKGNMIKALIIGVVILFVFFGTKLKRILFAPRRVHHRRAAALVRHRRRLPRSVGTHKMRTTAKKRPWQVKGSLAARRHMAQIRSRR